MSKAESAIEVIARGVWIEGGKVLLCQNTKAGYYYLPGGHVEFGEAAATALAREFREETGIEVQVGTCVLVTEGVFQAGKREHHELNLVFHVQHPPAPVESKEDAIAFEWVDLAGLVELDLRPDAVKAWLASGGVTEKPVAWLSQMHA